MKLRQKIVALHHRLSKYLRIFGRGISWALPTITQISIILAALTFFQQQDPLVAAHINHQTKLLSLQNSGIVPVSIRFYAMQFHVNFIEDAAYHMSLSKDKPIDFFSTRGGLPNTIIWPFSTRAIDLTKTQLEFDKWSGQNPDDIVYCIAFEKTSWLGKTSTDALLTPMVKFSAALFGSFNPGSAMGGGFPAVLFVVEKEMKDTCLTVFDKAR